MAFSFLTSVFGGPAGALTAKAMGDETTAKMDKAFNSAIKVALSGPAAPFLHPTGHTSTVRDTSESYINDRMALQFGDSNDCKKWVRELDDYIAVGCFKVVKALKEESSRGGNNLGWDEVLRVFNQNNYVDKSRDKNIEGRKSWNEMNYFKFDGSPDVARKRQIIAWLKTLFNEQQEEAIVDNSIIFGEELLSELADIASQSGATVKGPMTLVAADEEERKKVKEVGLIRFPTKGESKIKLYHIVIYSWSECSRFLFAQRDQNGIEVKCKVCQFKVDTSAIDRRCASEAKQEMSKPDFFDF